MSPPPQPSPQTHQSLDALRKVARTGDPADALHLVDGSVLPAPATGIVDATRQLRNEHSKFSTAPEATAAADAVRKLLRRTGHRPPATNGLITVAALREGLNSIGERSQITGLKPAVCADIVAQITQDMAGDMAKPAPDAEDPRWDQLRKDFERNDVLFNGQPMSSPRNRAGFPALRARLEQLPEQVQAFVRAACHQGTLAAPVTDVLLSLHRDGAILRASSSDRGFDIDTRFLIQLDDPEYPRVIVHHWRNIAAAASMQDVIGAAVDPERAPPTNADSALDLQVEVTLDTRSGQLTATGSQSIDLSYASPRAQILDRMVRTDTDIAPLVSSVQEYAGLLLQERRAYLATQPHLSAAETARFEHEWHTAALDDLARYRGEEVDVVATAIAARVTALTGQLIDGDRLLDTLIGSGQLPLVDRPLAMDAIAQSTPLACTRGLVEAAIARVNNALPIDRILSTPVLEPASTRSEAHPQVLKALRDAQLLPHTSAVPAMPPTRPVMPPSIIPPLLQEQLAPIPDPVALTDALTAATILVSDLLTAAQTPDPDACARWMLDTHEDSGRSGLERWITQARQLIGQGVLTSLPLDMQRFAYEQLDNHLQRTPMDGARVSDLLDTVLRQGVPDSIGRSRDTYLAFCNLIASALYTSRQPPVAMRPGLRDTSIEQVRREQHARASPLAPLSELEQLLPTQHHGIRRLLPGTSRWMTAQVRPPPLPQRQTSREGAPAEGVQRHLWTMLDCINQIADAAFPESGQIRHAQAPARQIDGSRQRAVRDPS